MKFIDSEPRLSRELFRGVSVTDVMQGAKQNSTHWREAHKDKTILLGLLGAALLSFFLTWYPGVLGYVGLASDAPKNPLFGVNAFRWASYFDQSLVGVTFSVLLVLTVSLLVFSDVRKTVGKPLGIILSIGAGLVACYALTVVWGNPGRGAGPWVLLLAAGTVTYLAGRAADYQYRDMLKSARSQLDSFTVAGAAEETTPKVAANQVKHTSVKSAIPGETAAVSAPAPDTAPARSARSGLDSVRHVAGRAKHWWIWGCYVCMALTTAILGVRGIMSPVSSVLLTAGFAAYAFYLYRGGSFVMYVNLFLLAPLLVVFALTYHGPSFGATAKSASMTCGEYQALGIAERTKAAKAVAWDQTPESMSDSLREMGARGYIDNFCDHNASSTKLQKYVDDPGYYLTLPQ